MLTFWSMAISLIGSSYFWHEAGHRAVARIAHDHLKPSAAATIDGLLKSLPSPTTAANSVIPPDPFNEHPGFHPSGTPKIKAATLDDAAEWPDKVRGNKFLHRDNWHYINFSVNGPGGHAPALVGGKAVDAIVALVAIARDKNQPKPTRAMAIAWIAHVVGDIHQPLHAVAYFDSKHPWSGGDRGGNRYLLKPDGKWADSPNLHAFWDGVVGEGAGDVPALLARTKKLPEPSAGQLSINMNALKLTVTGWAKESLAIARKTVYQIGTDGKSKLSADASKFSAASQPGARGVADARVNLAGYRLAALLNAAFK